jgi:hypothetical protein
MATPGAEIVFKEPDREDYRKSGNIVNPNGRGEAAWLS